MASKWRDNIARDWSVKRKRTALIGYIMGILKDAGVLKGSYDAIATIARINKNTRTLSKYMSCAKKEPYYGWLLDYVKHSLIIN